ncbi:MAG TPA: hypothetical protein PKK26_05745 [Candidatus Wallbacteria bacterium]|nr:hypothetical protein [Candidatus Wallbacteria bacterium]
MLNAPANKLGKKINQHNDRGSALLIVMGILSVIFVFGFGYANYLSGQVYLLEREKDYEAARMILRSGITEAIYVLNFDNAIMIQKLKKVNPDENIKPYEFFEPRVETTEKLMEKVFEKFKNRKLRIVFELAEVMPFQNGREGEKFARFIVRGHFNAGMLYTKIEGEIIARLSLISYNKRSSVSALEINPDRIFAVVNTPAMITNSRYFGICVFAGADPKAAKEAAEKSPEFRGALVMPDGTLLTNRMSNGEYCLTFGPIIMKN